MNDKCSEIKTNYTKNLTKEEEIFEDEEFKELVLSRIYPVLRVYDINTHTIERDITRVKNLVLVIYNNDTKEKTTILTSISIESIKSTFSDYIFNKYFTDKISDGIWNFLI